MTMRRVRTFLIVATLCLSLNAQAGDGETPACAYAGERGYVVGTVIDYTAGSPEYGIPLYRVVCPDCTLHSTYDLTSFSCPAPPQPETPNPPKREPSKNRKKVKR